MSKSKHTNLKSKKINIKYILAVALIFVILLILKNVYSVQTITLANVNKDKYLQAENEQVSQGKVYVNYVDSQGKVLSNQEVLTGNLGDEYTTSRKSIEGYKSYGNDPINKIGNYDEKDVNVNYVYESKIEDVNTTTDGSTVTVQVIKNKDDEKQEIKFALVTINENGEILKGGKYVVTTSSSNVIRNAVSYADKLIIGSLTLDSNGTDKYYIDELMAPEGYAKLAEKLQVSIVKTLNEETGVYSVSASISDEEISSVNVENGEVVVTIKKKTDNEPKPDPTPDPEPEPEKIFDLQVSKSVKKAILTTEGKEKTIEKNGDGLVKIDIPKSKVAGSSLKVIYEISIKNVGEVAGYATEIDDILPADMQLVQDENWTEQNGIAITNVLEDVRIEPGESVSCEVTLNWNLTEENIGLRVNQVAIATYYNEEGLKDNTPDNKGEESILVTIKTGKAAIITIEVVIALAIAGGIVYVVKKKNK